MDAAEDEGLIDRLLQKKFLAGARHTDPEELFILGCI